MADIDALEHITTQLQEYGGRQKPMGEWHEVQCPHHNDNSPSCGIVITREHRKYRIGSYHCFSCGRHGSWNEFAEVAGLQPMKGFDVADKNVSTKHVDRSVDEELLGTESFTLSTLLQKMGCPEAIPWLENMDWRGYKGKFIKKFGGLIIADEFNDDVAVLFPVVVNGRVRGGVKAMAEKREGRTSYITMKGEWVNNYGLFGYDYAKALMKRKGIRVIFLVEGPRDCLALLKIGIPAVAILGANAISLKKAKLILQLAPDLVYCLPDNDHGGDAMWANVKRVMTKLNHPLKKISLPKDYDSDGRLIKIDPGNMCRETKLDILQYLADRHGFKHPWVA